jgi:hypothetical protein
VYTGGTSAAGLHIYLNGVAVDNSDAGSGSFSAMHNSASAVAIGSDSSGAATFNGSMSDAFFTAKVLSASEVWNVTQILKSALELP